MTDSRNKPKMESGFALPAALVVSLLVALLVAAIAVSTMGSIERNRAASAESSSRAAAEVGANAFLKALNGGLVGDYTNYSLGANDAAFASGQGSSIITPAGELARVVTAGNFAIPASVRSPRSLTVQGGRYIIAKAPTSAGAPYLYWQPYAIVRPDWKNPFDSPGTATSGSELIVYIRGWIGPPPAQMANMKIKNASIIRASFRPGRFSDYQMVADGTIVSMGTATQTVQFNGPVHSNGLPDRLLSQETDYNGAQIYLKNVSCGANAKFTTLSGDITMATSPSCAGKGTENTARAVDLRGLANESARAWRLCGGGSGSWSPTSSFGGDSFRLVCTTTPAASYSVSSLLSNAALGNGRASVVFVSSRPIRITGGMVPRGRRLTVIVHPTSGASTQGTSITVTGNVGMQSAGFGLHAGSLALMAAGDVIPGFGNGYCPVNTMNGLFVAASGGLILPEEWRTSTFQDDSFTPTCPGLTVTGSIVGHYPPLLARTTIDGATTVLGFGPRNYNYDDRLYFSPPPMVPLSAPWQRESYDDVNSKCFTLSGPTATATVALTNSDCT